MKVNTCVNILAEETLIKSTKPGVFQRPFQYVADTLSVPEFFSRDKYPMPDKLAKDRKLIMIIIT